MLAGIYSRPGSGLSLEPARKKWAKGTVYLCLKLATQHFRSLWFLINQKMI